MHAPKLFAQNIPQNTCKWHFYCDAKGNDPFASGCDPGKMRNCMGVRISGNEIVFRLSNPGIENIQAHIRYRLIDEVSGYRNNWKKMLP